MKKERTLRFLVATLGLVAICLFGHRGVDQHPALQLAEPPNVIFIFPDQYRNSSVGIWSKPEYQQYLRVAGDPVITPAIDKLASEGILFSQAISNFPLCSPYRAMLISGMYPSRNGVNANCNKDRESTLKSDIPGVTGVFASQGYDVSYFRKVHWMKNDPLFDKEGNYVGSTESPGGNYINNYDTYLPPGPDRHGIDYFFQLVKDDHFNPMVYSNDPILIEGKSDGQLYRPGRFNAEIESEAIIKYLENTHGQRDPSKPFFMIWSLNPPHNPWNESSTKMEYFDQYTEQGKVNLDKLLTHSNADQEAGKHAPYYFANVSAVDHYIGLVLEKLEALDMVDNTIIVFSSDHGEMLGSHGKDGKNTPEIEAVNIPFIIKWGNKLKHRVEDRIVSVPDVMPTLISLAGYSSAIPEDVQGSDFSDLVLDENSVASKPKGALIIGYNYRGLYTGNYTFVVQAKANSMTKAYCYDNQADPYQMNPISSEELSKIQELMFKAHLVELLKETEDEWVDKQVAGNYLKYQ